MTAQFMLALKNRFSLRAVTAEVRELNRLYEGPGTVTLVFNDDRDWKVIHYDDRIAIECEYKLVSERTEEIPGDDRKFNAVGVARRLIAGLPLPR